MREQNQPSTSAPSAGAVRPRKKLVGSGRREFLEQVGVAATLAVGVLASPSTASAQLGGTLGSGSPGSVSPPVGVTNPRVIQSFNNRVNAATAESLIPVPQQVTNGDETNFPNHIGNYSKGLIHNSIGEVDSSSYQSLLNAVNSGNPSAFDQIQLGGNTPLVDPQAGLAFDLEGTDSHQLAIGTPPSVASQSIADAAVENYWMALCRDVNFTQYGNEPLTAAAIAELNSLRACSHPKPVTPQNLFRGFTAGDLLGPYMSQFLLQPFNYGAVPVSQSLTTYVPGIDYMTDQASWLAVQNGQGPFGQNQADPNAQHVRNGRGLAAYVHVDVLYEAYLNACLLLLDSGAPLDPNNPYANSRTQTGFGTFGAPHVKTLVAEVSQRALKAVWYVKWFVHRHLRPEEYGGLVHITKSGQKTYPLNADILNSQAVARVFSRYGTYLLPHAFPEGCPQHPSYGQGHATTSIPGFQITQASEDGLSLVPYAGLDQGQLTIGGEMNKVAANIGLGRAHAGVHWRYDYTDSLPLGEAVAISMLTDMAHCWNEPFAGFSFTKFDGTRITGVGANT